MKYFTIEELCASHTAARAGINNAPSDADKERLTALIKELLDPLRELWGRPLKVNSGFRCAELNGLVRGGACSQHMRGEAADITAGSSMLNKQLFNVLKYSGLAFDQLIDESAYSWLHVSYSTLQNRRQVLHL